MADQEVNIENFQAALDELEARFGISDRSLSDFVKNIKKSTGDFKKEISNLNKDISKNKKGYQDQTAMLSKLDSAIDELTDTMENEQDVVKKTAAAQEKAALIAQRDALQTSASMQGLSEATAKATTQLAQVAATGAGRFVKGLQDNATGIDLASGLMNAGIDMATGGLQAAGKGAQAVAPMLMALGPYGIAAGIALEFLGIAADKGAETVNKLAKFGVEVLQKEVEKTVKSFNTLSGSGAIFADGMTGMVNASGAAGLTIEQFSNVLKANSESLGQSGLGMAEGGKLIGRVATDLKKSGVQNQLMKLGYSVEDQAGLIAEVTSNMRRAAGGAVVDADVAEQTKRYAESLRLIASITGEDAKTKVAAASAAANELIFQQKLAGKSTEQRAQITAAMATMTEMERKNFVDRVALGEVVNKEGAIYEATIGGAREKGLQALSLFETNRLTADTNAKLNVQYGEQLRRGVLDQQAIGMAAHVAGSNLTGVATGMADTLKQSNEYNKKSYDSAKKNMDEAGKTTDGLTTGVIGAEQAAQALKVALQTELLPAVTKFASVSQSMLSAVQNTLDQMGLGDPNRKKQEKAEKENLLAEYKKQYGWFAESRMREDKIAYDREKDRAEKLAKIKEEQGEEAYQKQLVANIRSRNAEGRRAAGPNLYAQHEVEKTQPTINGHAEVEKTQPTIKGHALGGKIAAGEIGMVGEQGRELVQGPATVTTNSKTNDIVEVARAMRAVIKNQSNKNGFKSQLGISTASKELSTLLTNLQFKPTADYTDMQSAKDAMGIAAKSGNPGSMSSYQATLHGTDAVAPLPSDNKSTPVNIESSLITTALQQQTTLMKEVLDAIVKGNRYSAQISVNTA